ncbi:MAG: hypothetical protein ABIJ27_00950 [Candidatus Omnitrophota bacterium]
MGIALSIVYTVVVLLVGVAIGWFCSRPLMNKSKKIIDEMKDQARAAAGLMDSLRKQISQSAESMEALNEKFSAVEKARLDAEERMKMALGNIESQKKFFSQVEERLAITFHNFSDESLRQNRTFITRAKESLESILKGEKIPNNGARDPAAAADERKTKSQMRDAELPDRAEQKPGFNIKLELPAKEMLRQVEGSPAPVSPPDTQKSDPPIEETAQQSDQPERMPRFDIKIEKPPQMAPPLAHETDSDIKNPEPPNDIDQKQTLSPEDMLRKLNEDNEKR